MADPQQAVQEVIDELTGSGRELGLQVAAYVDGKLVVDAVSGVADEASGRPVTPDTLFTVFSVTKGPTATCVHILADRGKLDYDAPIAKYWPEFAQNGKEKATVRDALTHRVGIPQMPADATVEWISDWDRMANALAAEAPVWEPGTKSGYHAYTYGWILGEILRRIDGRPIAQFVQDEICKPLGITDLYFGIPDEVEPRVATLKDGPRPQMPPPPPDALMPKAIPPHIPAGAGPFNRPEVRRASIPAAGGIMNARSLARHYAVLALGGELDGVRIISEKQLKTATQLQTEEPDAVIGQPNRKALGYWLGGRPLDAMGPRITAFGHTGAGGALGFADPELKLGFGITKNLLTVAAPGEGTAYLVAEAIRSSL